MGDRFIEAGDVRTAVEPDRYRGRHGLFEWLSMSETLREQIAESSAAFELRQRAMKEGMQTLRDAGIEAVLNG